MKKNLHYLLLCLFTFSFFGAINAQQPVYQLENSGFETWYLETSNTASVVPTGFNSFYSATGSVASLSMAQRVWSSTDVRPGSTGSYSAQLKSNTVIGVRANGNVTTGRIYAGSMTANSASNYNFTDLTPTTQYTTPNPSKFCQEITGTPDSLRFWVKYLPGRNGATNTTDKGRIRIYIHGTGECRDAPMYPSGMTETQLYYGRAMKEFLKEDGGWHCYQVPFEYTGTNIQKNENGNYYVLLSMTTNATPGGGANNDDYAYFDDIEFIYSAWLTDLKVNGETIDGFQKGLLEYGGPKLTGNAPYEFPYQPANFSWTPEASDILGVVVTNVNGPNGDADGGYTSILVTAEDGVTTKEYRIHYFLNLSDNNSITAMSYTMDGTTPIPVPGFSPTQVNYPILLTNPEEVIIPQIVEESIVLSDPTASIQNILQPTGVNSKGTVIVRAENLSLKSYNLLFSKVVSGNSKLNWIKIANVDIPDFHPDTLEYNYEITTCVAAIPAITYEKSSAYANVNYTAATMTNRTATITVMAENNTQTVYKINFALTNNNTVLSGYRVASTNRNNVFTAANNYTDPYSAAFTAFPALALSTTSGQQGCAQQEVEFPATNNVVFYPDTNYIKVTAQDGITKQTYKSVLKNTNCYLKQTTGNNVGLKYLYNGVIRNITIPSASNNNDVTVNVTIPVTGPNLPPVLVEADPQAPVVDTIIYVQPISRTGNSGSVTVYPAHDNGTSKKYIINFTPTLSTDATLNSITYNGFQVPGFNPVTELYTLIFPSNVTEVPDIDFSPSFEWLPEENMIFTPAASLYDTAFIEVTAENGTAKKTYKISFEVVEQLKDAYLTDIRYNNKTIANFNPTKYNYTEDIPYSAPTPPEIVPYASSPTALIFPSIQLNEPPYTKSFLVYSEDMTVQRIYTVNFNLIKNKNPFLADIKINGTSLQDFNSQTFEYEHEFSYTEWNAPVVSATPIYQFAQVDITQIDNVTGTVTITVTAEDDLFSSVYTIDFTRILSPVTDINTIVYEYNDQTNVFEVTHNETEITIMLPVETEGEPTITSIQLADTRAVYMINEQPDETNNFTGTVVITAEDLSEETYTIAFVRTLSTSTFLTGIWYNGILVPDFDIDVLTYTIILDYNTSQIPNVTAAAAWNYTDVVVVQASNPFGQATVSVTSEDGLNTKTYTIIFQRDGNPYLVDLFYSLDGTNFPLVPAFNPSIFVYDILLPIATSETPILEYLIEDDRCDIILDLQTTPNGTSSIKIITWNQKDSLTYTVNFTVELSTEALLIDLQVDGVTIPNFISNTFHYTFPEYEYGKSDFPEIIATAKYPDATVVIDTISAYPGTATITVTAGDVTISNSYTIDFSVDAGDNTYLFDLLMNNVHFWLFNKNTFFYTYPTSLGMTQFPVFEGITDDPKATVDTIQAYQFGDTAKIIVTAQNGDVAIYQIYFPAPKNNNAYLEMIFIDGKPLEGFMDYLSDYTYTLPYYYTGKPLVSVLLQDINATYEEDFPNHIPLKCTIYVTAENGTDRFTYTVNFERENSIISFHNEAEIHVYPNPSSDIIHFEIDELNQTCNLEIFSVEGKKVGSHTLQNGINTLNVTHLQKGIYFYKILSDKTMIGAGKFIKN